MFDNLFLCDCQSLWLKRWIWENQMTISHWNKITCSSLDDEKIMVNVKDSAYICDGGRKTKYLLSSLISSACLLFAAVVSPLLYLFRMEIKVLLYIKFGIHPYDKSHEEASETIDCLVIHSKHGTDWVMANVVKYLEASAYSFNVYVAERDFVVGYSIEENLTRLVRKSKRVMFCLSDDFNETSENFRLAWNISAKKIKETKSNCGIVVYNGSSIIKNTGGINVERVIRKDRILYSDKRLFVQKLTYTMPHIPRKLRTDCNLDMKRLSNNAYEETIHNIFESKKEEGIPDGQLRQYDVFISYANDDIDYVINDLLPLLERKGHKSCIPDRDCIAGPTKQETILTAIKSSHRTILMLSDHHSLDEWSLFTFQMACGKQDERNTII